MLNFFKKQPTIEFLCVLSGALETYPPEPIKNYKPKWLTDTITEFAKSDRFEATVGKCPGIRKILTTGWIIKTWQDIDIIVHDDGMFEWRTPYDEGGDRPDGLNTIGYHDKSTFKHSEFLSKKIPLIKFQIPWRAKPPKGYDILVMPVPYQEHDDYTTETGIWENEFGIMALNIVAMWNKPGKFHIPAGTPIAHLMLVKKEKYNYVARYATDKEIVQIQTITRIIHNKFTTNYKEMKQSISKVFNMDKCPFHHKKK